ncbi:MAG: glycosyltransferase family 9 protein, partial [Chloroflexi bacterium]|nr:glycosyltransferase family 9 protein [Chloroflexota bacterium]
MNKQQYKRIVVLRSGGLGDCMLATPALAALRKAFPDSHITLVGDPFSADVFVNSPDIDSLIAMDSKQMRPIDYARALWKLRRQRFSLLIDMHGNGRTFTQTLALGAPRRVGFE